MEISYLIRDKYFTNKIVERPLKNQRNYYYEKEYY